MANISKEGVITTEGIKIVDLLNAVTPKTQATAITNATYSRAYEDQQDPIVETMTAICDSFVNKINEIKTKLRTAGILEVSSDPDAKTSISTEGVITPQGINILNKLNISLPTATTEASVNTSLVDYARVDVFEDTYPTTYTGFLAAITLVVDNFNDLLTKLRTAGYLGTELSEDGIITPEGTKIYNRLQDRFTVFCSENHANLEGYIYYGQEKNWTPISATEAINDIADAIDYLNALLAKLRASGIIAE